MADLTDQKMTRLSLVKRQLLKRLARERRGAAPKDEQLVSRSSPGPALLSFAQERMWLVDRLHPDNPVYNMFEAWRLRGVLRVDVLTSAMNALLERQGALRTRFHETGESLVQALESVAFPVEEIDLRSLPVSSRWLECSRRLDQAVQCPFDLTMPPLARACLLRLHDDEYVLLVVMHHIAADGWSRAIFRDELAQAYAAGLQGRVPDWPPLPVQYADYAEWQRRWLSGEVLDRQLGYWRERLRDLNPLELPADRPRPARLSYRGDHERFALPAELVAALKTLGYQHNATLYMVLLSAFQVLLMRYSGQEDIAVGTPIAGRTRPELEGLIGFFVNTLVMRGDLGGNPRFADLLVRTRQHALDAYDHQELPFEKLVEELKPERDMSRSPLVQVMFILQNTPDTELRLPGLVCEQQPLNNGTAKFDLSLFLTETAGELHGSLEYSTDLFDAARIERLANHYRTLLEGIAAEPEQHIYQLPMLTEAERQLLLVEWNDATVQYPDQQNVAQCFEDQVRLNPDAIAVQFRQQSLDYAELNRRANRLAHHLRSLGVGTDSLVGLCVERSPELVVGILAVLKAGGAYVPLDPDYPQERLNFMLEDTGATVVLTQTALADRLPRVPHLLCLDGEFVPWSSQPDSDPPARGGPDDLAYVIYTSGSTGQPKGVMATQRAISNHMRWREAEFEISCSDAVLQKTSISSDASVWEFFAPLLNGGRLVLAEPWAHRDPAYLVRALREYGVSLLQVVPTMLRVLVAEPTFRQCDSLRLVCAGGEALERDLLLAFRQQCAAPLYNLYGPTEATVDSHFWLCGEESSTVIPIGRPISNTTCYVLDAQGNLVPVGVAGELYIGGAGLARGYLNRPELSAERFVASPSQSGERLYRTGDRVRWREDGVLEFLGRIDHQISLRGYRIEPGEIEAVLQGDPAVRQSLAMVREDVPGDRRLVAYLVGQGIDLDAARARLKAHLPDYMMPGALVVLDDLPQTPNGKVDRKALPVPDQPTSDVGYQAPRTPIETALAGIWADTLKIPRVGIHDDFFDLGGHSLLAAQMVNRINRELETAITLRQLFEAPTVGGLALAVKDTPTSVLALVPRPVQGAPCELSFAQKRLWLIEHLDPVPGVYNVSRVYRISGALNPAAVQAALDAVVARHEALRTRLVEQDGVLRQIIDPPRTVELQLRDMRADADDAGVSNRDDFLRTITHSAFDLSADCMLRAGLARLGEAQWMLAITVHHVATDGWSLSVLDRELEALYAGFDSGSPATLPPLPVQYADYAEWQRRWLSGEVLERQLGYWRERLRDLNPLELPADRPRPARLSYRGDHERFALPAELVDALKGLARQHNATLYMVLLSAFQVLLMRYSGQEDITVGTPIACRTRPELEGLIGLFVNTLVMRGDLGGNPRFADLLVRTRQHALDAYDHQELPFEKIVEELKPERDMSRSPLVQVMFILQNTPDTELRLPGLVCERLPLSYGTKDSAKFDLSLFLTETGGELHGSLEYSTDLFDAARIERLARHYRSLLEHIVQAPDTAIWQLNLLDTAEQQMLLHDWNDTTTDYPLDRCVHEVFEAQVARAPDAVAVVSGDQQLSYRELDAQANRLAHHLRGLGVGPEARVGLCLERSPELVVGMLAVLKAGGAYLPLDPDYPQDRLAMMLEDAGAAVVLTRSGLEACLPDSRAARLLCLDTDRALWSGQPTTLPPNTGATPDSLAYVIYTSGSTGTPKGVEVCHTNILRLVCGTDYAGFDEDRTFLLLAPIAFDASTFELWGALLNGARCVIYPDRVPTPDVLGAVLQRHKVDTLWLTASLFNFIVDEQPTILEGVSQLLTGGEALSLPHVRRALSQLPDTQLINGYGPTESTTFACCYPIPNDFSDDVSSVPIGGPISNTACYVLDAVGNLVPVGVAGELYIGGAGLARGYLNRPELSAERFVASPFQTGERLYRTGDRVRWREDGVLEFLGRMDRQIKLRGYRIEPGEIEAVLQGDPAVRQSLAMVREDVPGDRRLVAYLVGQGIDLDAARARLKVHLPDYMMPGALVVLDDLPLTPNGKVDRKVLPVPDQPTSDEGYQAPRTPIETALAGIWADILKLPRVGINDNFFDLGGHSLLAARTVNRINRELETAITLSELFEAPTVGGLALAVLEQLLEANDETNLPPGEV